MLNGHICPVTAVVSTVGIISAAIMASKAKNKPSAARFGAITALIFAGQMMNFTIQNGTSGHFLGAVLAVSLLGLPFGVLAMALVVAIQCLMFSDGGLFVLGANIMNMSIIGAGLGGLIYHYLSRGVETKSAKHAAVLGVSAWISLMCAVFACCLELAISGTTPFAKVVGAMFGVHAMIGVGEALITVGLFYAFGTSFAVKTERTSAAVPLLAAGMIAAVLSPFASGFPDGLEWVAAKYQFLHESAPAFASPLADYAFSPAGDALATPVAGLVGVIVTFVVACAVIKMMSVKRSA